MIAQCPLQIIQIPMIIIQPHLILALSLFIQLANSCQDTNCFNCDTYLNNTSITQTCYQCIQGFKLSKSNVCVQDVGLIVGIAIGSAGAIAIQVLLYIFCRVKFSQFNKKKTDVTLEDIYKEDEVSQEGKKQEGEDYSVSLKTQFKIYVRNNCGICDQKKTSIKTQCGHYFHHQCFKAQVSQTPDLCPKCVKRGLSPIQMICSRCLNKKRQIPLQSISNFEFFKEFYCVSCKLKNKKEIDAKKWWRRCC